MGQITNNKSQIAIDVSDLPMGQYFLKITTTDGTIATKNVIK